MKNDENSNIEISSIEIDKALESLNELTREYYDALDTIVRQKIEISELEREIKELRQVIANP